MHRPGIAVNNVVQTDFPSWWVIFLKRDSLKYIEPFSILSCTYFSVICGLAAASLSACSACLKFVTGPGSGLHHAGLATSAKIIHFLSATPIIPMAHMHCVPLLKSTSLLLPRGGSWTPHYITGDFDVKITQPSRMLH